MIETIALGVIGCLQAYVLTKLDTLESRIDSIRDGFHSISWEIDRVATKIDQCEPDVGKRGEETLDNLS